MWVPVVSSWSVAGTQLVVSGLMSPTVCTYRGLTHSLVCTPYLEVGLERILAYTLVVLVLYTLYVVLVVFAPASWQYIASVGSLSSLLGIAFHQRAL